MAPKKKPERKKLTEEEVEKLKQMDVEEEEYDTRPDEEVLLQPDIVVKTVNGEVILKPWTYGMFYKFADKIEDIFEDLEGKNINLDAFLDFQTWIASRPEDATTTVEDIEEYFSKRKDANKEFRKLVNRVAPHAMPILVHSTGLSEEEIEALPLMTTISIGIMIYFQNAAVLGNALGLFDGAFSTGEPQEQN